LWEIKQVMPTKFRKKISMRRVTPLLACVTVIFVLPFLGAMAGFAQQQPPPASVGSRLTLQEALAKADRQNLDLAATRLQHLVSQAGIIIAGQRPNPTVTFSATRDTPHESVFFDQPVELPTRRTCSQTA
jgi:hypothetical protein